MRYQHLPLTPFTLVKDTSLLVLLGSLAQQIQYANIFAFAILFPCLRMFVILLTPHILEICRIAKHLSHPFYHCFLLFILAIYTENLLSAIAEWQAKAADSSHAKETTR